MDKSLICYDHGEQSIFCTYTWVFRLCLLSLLECLVPLVMVSYCGCLTVILLLVYSHRGGCGRKVAVP